MRNEALQFEREHYQSTVEHYESAVATKNRELAIKLESLKVLQELFRGLDYNPSKRIIQDDIESCENEISELKDDIRLAESNLKAFKRITEQLEAII